MIHWVSVMACMGTTGAEEEGTFFGISDMLLPPPGDVIGNLVTYSA